LELFICPLFNLLFWICLLLYGLWVKNVLFSCDGYMVTLLCIPLWIWSLRLSTVKISAVLQWSIWSWEQEAKIVLKVHVKIIVHTMQGKQTSSAHTLFKKYSKFLFQLNPLKKKLTCLRSIHQYLITIWDRPAAQWLRTSAQNNQNKYNNL
jgi:hypothetical protein